MICKAFPNVGYLIQFYLIKESSSPAFGYLILSFDNSKSSIKLVVLSILYLIIDHDFYKDSNNIELSLLLLEILLDFSSILISFK